MSCDMLFVAFGLHNAIFAEGVGGGCLWCDLLGGGYSWHDLWEGIVRGVMW